MTCIFLWNGGGLAQGLGGRGGGGEGGPRPPSVSHVINSGEHLQTSPSRKRLRVRPLERKVRPEHTVGTLSHSRLVNLRFHTVRERTV